MGLDTSEVHHLALDLSENRGRVGGKLARVVRRYADNIERDGKAFCPVLTGALRDSITTNLSGSGRAGGISATIGTELYYAAFVHDGTSRQSPQPFLTPALDKNVPGFERDVADVAEDIL